MYLGASKNEFLKNRMRLVGVFRKWPDKQCGTVFTGKPFSEALILASTNPQYDK